MSENKGEALSIFGYVVLRNIVSLDIIKQFPQCVKTEIYEITGKTK